MTLRVPSLVGLELEEAKTELAKAGLTLGRTPFDAIEAGIRTIVSQRPLPGDRVGKGTSVDLVVRGSGVAKPATAPGDPSTPASSKTSSADAVVNVPTLRGLGLAEARERLTRWGLALGRVDHQTTDASFPGTVVSQKPAAGRKQARGSSVSIVIAERLGSGATNNEAATAGEKPSTRNVITNFRATDRSPTELVVEVSAFYDGSKGDNQIVLSSEVSEGLSSFGSSKPLQVGPNQVMLAVKRSDGVKDFYSNNVRVCIGRRSSDSPEPKEQFLCETFPYLKKWSSVQPR